MNKQYRSSIMAAVHETAEDLHEAGLMDKFTMREFNELCFPLNQDSCRLKYFY